MKKIIITIITLALSLTLLFCIGSNKKLIHYTQPLEKIEKIKKERVYSNDVGITNLYFGDKKLILDEKTNIYYCTLNIDDVNDYNPTIEYNSTSNVKLAIENIEINNNSLQNSKEYTLLVYNKENYHEYKIVFTTLPLLNINIQDEIGADYIDATYTVINNGNEIGESNNAIYDIEGKIRFRGQSTSFYPKRSFRIKLNRINNLLNVRKGRDYILYAAYNDQERIRNVFCSNLWYESCAKDNDLGINAGMYYEYVELFINNEYWGLYALGFPIDEQQLQINTNNNMENIFKKRTWDSELNISEYSNEPVDGYELKTKLNDESWLFLRALYINTYKDYNENFLLGGALDNNNAINILLFYMFIQGVDNVDEYYFKNTYIITKSKYNQITYLYIPWDMDICLGNKWIVNSKNLTESYNFKPIDNFVMKSNPIYTIAKNNETIKNNIIDKYNNLRKTHWSNLNISNIIDNYEKDIYCSGAYLRDIERWPDSSQLDADTKLTKFKNYVLERLSYLDNNIEEALDFENGFDD